MYAWKPTIPEKLLHVLMRGGRIMIWKKLRTVLKKMFNPDFVVESDMPDRRNPDGFSGAVQPIGAKGKKTT